MKSSKQAQRDARQLFRSCLVNGVLDEQRARQVVAAIGQKQLRGHTDVLARFHRLVRLELARRHVRVENAVETTPEQMKALESKLTGIYGSGLTYEYWIRRDLVGGLRIQVGSDLYDGTVKTRLEQLEQSF